MGRGVGCCHGVVGRGGGKGLVGRGWKEGVGYRHHGRLDACRNNLCAHRGERWVESADGGLEDAEGGHHEGEGGRVRHNEREEHRKRGKEERAARRVSHADVGDGGSVEARAGRDAEHEA